MATNPTTGGATKTYLIDGVSAVAIHNGVVRVQFMKLNVDGKPENSVEIAIPNPQLRSILDALVKASKG